MATENKKGNEKKKHAPAPAVESPECTRGKDKGRKDKGAKKQKAAVELAGELKKLRVTLKEIVQHLSLCIDSRIADTLLVLEKKQVSGEPGALPRAKTSLQLTKKLQELKLKPAKGKPKDVAGISRLVEKIAGKMPKQS